MFRRAGHVEWQDTLPLQLEHGPCWPWVSACSCVYLTLEGGPLLPHFRQQGGQSPGFGDSLTYPHIRAISLLADPPAPCQSEGVTVGKR